MKPFTSRLSCISRLYLALFVCTLACITSNIHGAVRPAAPADQEQEAQAYEEPDPDIVYIETKNIKTLGPAAPVPTATVIAGEYKVPEKTALPPISVSLATNKDPEHQAKFQPLYDIVYNYHMGNSERTLTDLQARNLFYDACRYNDKSYLSALLQQSAQSEEVLDQMSEDAGPVKINPETREFIERVYGFLYLIHTPDNMKKKLLEDPELLPFIGMRLEIAATLSKPPTSDVVDTILETYPHYITLHRAQHVLRLAEMKKIELEPKGRHQIFIPVITSLTKFMQPRIDALYKKLENNNIITIHEANALFFDICQEGNDVDEQVGMLADLFSQTPVEAYLMQNVLESGKLDPEIASIIRSTYDFFYRTNTVDDIKKICAKESSLLNFINARLVIAIECFSQEIITYFLTTYPSNIMSQTVIWLYNSLNNEIVHNRIPNVPVAMAIVNQLRDFVVPVLEKKLKAFSIMSSEEVTILFLDYIQNKNRRKLQFLSEVVLLPAQDLLYLSDFATKLGDPDTRNFLLRIYHLFYDTKEQEHVNFGIYLPLRIEQAIKNGQYNHARDLLILDDIRTQRYPELLRRALHMIEKYRTKYRLPQVGGHQFVINRIEKKLREAIEAAKKAAEEELFDKDTPLPLPDAGPGKESKEPKKPDVLAAPATPALPPAPEVLPAAQEPAPQPAAEITTESLDPDEEHEEQIQGDNPAEL